MVRPEWKLVVLLLFLFAGLTQGMRGAEVIPPKPARYFNDYAGVVTPGTAAELNRQLEDFERTDGSQIVVAIFPKMQSESSVADYTVRVAQAWSVGQKGKNNGAVLFVFLQDRELFLQVGYGLEGAIPDATAKTIIEQEIKPHLRQGNFDAGMTAGVKAMLRAARGEYQGTGRTAAERGPGRSGQAVVIVFVAAFILLMIASRRSRGTVYRRSGRSTWTDWPGGWGGGGWGGGGWSGGGGGGGGWSSGGSFSSGGGSFGGGGAGGRW